MKRLALLVAVVAGACGANASPAHAITGVSGPISVTVSPTSGLTDGQAIKIHATAKKGSDLFEIRAHLCMHAPPPEGGITNTFDFGFDGAYCSKPKLSPNADSQTEFAIAPSTTGEGDLAFKVGVGTGAPWKDLDGVQHTLTCGPGHPCDLVVQFQIPNNTIFYTAPLSFGSDPALASDTEDGGTKAGNMPSTGFDAAAVAAIGLVAVALGALLRRRGAAA